MSEGLEAMNNPEALKKEKTLAEREHEVLHAEAESDGIAADEPRWATQGDHPEGPDTIQWVLAQEPNRLGHLRAELVACAIAWQADRERLREVEEALRVAIEHLTFNEWMNDRESSRRLAAIKEVRQALTSDNEEG